MKRLAALLAVALAGAPSSAGACTVCMGDPGSNIASAANAAIFLMLGMLALVFAMLGYLAYTLHRHSKLPPPAHTEFDGATPAHDLQ